MHKKVISVDFKIQLAQLRASEAESKGFGIDLKKFQDDRILLIKSLYEQYQKAGTADQRSATSQQIVTQYLNIQDDLKGFTLYQQITANSLPADHLTEYYRQVGQTIPTMSAALKEKYANNESHYLNLKAFFANVKENDPSLNDILNETVFRFNSGPMLVALYNSGISQFIDFRQLEAEGPSRKIVNFSLAENDYNAIALQQLANAIYYASQSQPEAFSNFMSQRGTLDSAQLKDFPFLSLLNGAVEDIHAPTLRFTKIADMDRIADSIRRAYDYEIENNGLDPAKKEDAEKYIGIINRAYYSPNIVKEANHLFGLTDVNSLQDLVAWAAEHAIKP